MLPLTTKQFGCVLGLGWLALGCSSGRIESRLGPGERAELSVSPLVRINFQPASTVTPPGSFADTGAIYGDRGNGFSYGWGADNGAQARERRSSSSPDKLHDTLTHLQKPEYPNAVWELGLANGTYEVHVVSGDPSHIDSVFRIDAEGVRVVDGTPTSDSRWVAGTATVTISDGKLTITNGSGASNNKIAFLEVAALDEDGSGAAGSSGSAGAGGSPSGTGGAAAGTGGAAAGTGGAAAGSGGAAAGSGGAAAETGGAGAGGAGGSDSSAGGGGPGAAGGSPGAAGGSPTAAAGNSGAAGAPAGGSGGPLIAPPLPVGIGATGSVARSCGSGIPAGGQLVDTSRPTSIVGTGTAASCTWAALDAAVKKGGIVTFNCGASAATIAISATLKPPVDKDTVIDGGGKVTLDGGGAVQILNFFNPNYKVNEARLTIQRIAFVNAKQSGSSTIPPAPAPCSQGYNDGQGGAIFVRDGNLTVINSLFKNNAAANLGPDTGGGAIYILGSKRGALIVNSTFVGNTGSNGGAVYGLQAELHIVNSRFDGNKAVGTGANSHDPSMCSVVHEGQNQVGSGGNGGAITSDGVLVNLTSCGNEIINNAAGTGAFGGGLFYTSNDWGGVLTVADTTMSGNTGGWWTSVASGGVTKLGTAVGTNAKSITLSNSTLQGL